jgi:hypothetical protein
MGKSDIMHGICGAQDILQKQQYLMQGCFVKHFLFFKAHPLPKEQEVFQYRTKSPVLNHPGISAVFQNKIIWMNERSNDQTNERSEFWQHNGRTKIIWKNDE